MRRGEQRRRWGLRLELLAEVGSRLAGRREDRDRACARTLELLFSAGPGESGGRRTCG